MTANRGADFGNSKVKKKIVGNERKPVFASIFIHNHETRVYWQFFSLQKSFYQFLVKKMYNPDYLVLKGAN